MQLIMENMSSNEKKTKEIHMEKLRNDLLRG